jgi:hypothetical protein
MAHAQRARSSDRKYRLTLSLEADTIQYLKRRRIEANAPSLSACVEGLVTATRQRSEVEDLNMQTTAYYDAISSDERTENIAWGQLGERELLSGQR